METARAVMVKSHAFYACLVLNTKMVEDPTCDTAWTNYVSIGYNPDFIEGLDVPTVIFVLAHEVMHVALKHNIRRGTRNPEKWNRAADYAINWMLHEQGFKIWKSCLIDSKFKDMSAEQIYDLIRDEPGDGDGGGMSGDGGGMSGDLRPPPRMTEEQAAKVNTQVNRAIAQATMMAKARGQMPSNMEMLIENIYDEPIPWDQVLLEYMRRVIKCDENWSRRNRRFSNVVLPSRHSPGMNELVIVADSSGSMFIKEVFERVATAVDYIVRVVKPLAVRVVWADDDECSNQDFFLPGETIVLHPKGGGGTDMRLACNYVRQYDPEVVLLITDGYTPWDTEPYSYPLIVACTTDAPCPNYAQVVRIDVNSG
jgi:predicted metal-dependent peptidase